MCACDLCNQVQGTCMVCFSCEKLADNTWMFVSLSVKWSVAMVTFCLCQSDLFLTLRFLRAKVHIIHTTV